MGKTLPDAFHMHMFLHDGFVAGEGRRSVRDVPYIKTINHYSITLYLIVVIISWQIFKLYVTLQDAEFNFLYDFYIAIWPYSVCILVNFFSSDCVYILFGSSLWKKRLLNKLHAQAPHPRPSVHIHATHSI